MLTLVTDVALAGEATSTSAAAAMLTAVSARAMRCRRSWLGVVRPAVCTSVAMSAPRERVLLAQHDRRLPPSDVVPPEADAADDDTRIARSAVKQPLQLARESARSGVR